MKRCFALALILILPLALGSCGGSSGGDSTGPTGTATYDITGTWTGILGHVSVTGPCPPTPTQTGTITIVQTGDTFALTFGAGFACAPAAACQFVGIVEGTRYTAVNAGVADNEGGTYATEMEFDVWSPNHAEGFGTSVYTHPQMQCVWETTLTMDRD